MSLPLVKNSLPEARLEPPCINAMNELIYSFTGSLRAWVNSNTTVLQASSIQVDMPALTIWSSLHVGFTSERFEAGFYVWEKGQWHKAMSDIEFVDWRIADLEYQPEFVHYEYLTICEMFDVLDILRDRLILIQAEARQ